MLYEPSRAEHVGHLWLLQANPSNPSGPRVQARGVGTVGTDMSSRAELPNP